MTAVEFIQSLLVAGVAVSPLLGLPGFSLDLVALGWLRVVDLGTGADVLGNLFHEVTHFPCELFPANSKE